jgi:hypothetical protein
LEYQYKYQQGNKQMTTRTFKQYGYGIKDTDQPVTITVTLGGQEIFSGEIPSDTAVITELFSWETSLEFAGTQSFEIAAQHGSVYLGQTQCNHSVNEYNSPDDFGDCCIVQQDGYAFSECFSNVVIDGTERMRFWEPLPETPERPGQGLGQWHWTGYQFSATLTVQTATHYE